MSKARVDWAFGERPVSSSKLDQANTDYITPGNPIWSIRDEWFWDSGLMPAIQVPSTNIAWYPYNPQKSVADRLYLLGRLYIDAVDESDELEISFDTGANWTPAFPSITAGPVSFGADTLFEIWDLSAQVVSFQWLGIRISSPIATSANFRLHLLGFLYNSNDTPF